MRGAMTPEELDLVKRALKRQHDSAKELWLEKQLLRNLILDSGWMAERALDLLIEGAKSYPENVRQVEEHFASDDQLLAEIGLGDWLADFDKKYPRNE